MNINSSHPPIIAPAPTRTTTPKPVSSAPMPSAPMIYNADGSVAWEQMWGTFCTLASAGGPPHRGKMLLPPTDDDPTAPAYRRVGDELIRGIRLVSGLDATYAETGWLSVKCAHAAHARWLSEQIAQENVAAHAEGDCFFVPVGSTFTPTSEIKNVITVVAKTTHYWEEHLENQVKILLSWETRLVGAWQALIQPKR